MFFNFVPIFSKVCVYIYIMSLLAIMQISLTYVMSYVGGQAQTQRSFQSLSTAL